MFGPYKLEALSTFAGDIDGIIILITVLVGFWFILAQGALLGFSWRYRRQEGRRASYISGENAREFKWVFVPLALIVMCDIYIALSDGPVWAKVKEDLPKSNAVINVIAQQWAWTFVHPGPDGTIDTADDVATVGEMHVEVGKVYHFRLSSKDVLHSFSVPVFRLKQDIIPGRVITGWFEATGTGTYDIQCTEICGIGHGLMPARIVIETPEQHAAWVAEHSALSFAATDLPYTAQE
ncbi:MAG TPA: cytochrome c oxidase subunit II [Planctomycetaceae bacterium]|nr:cytochrome c oxidase subunit II [Planctomycetaceae bacterium]